MAIVRRHWRSLVVQAMVVAVIIGLWLAMPAQEASRAQAQEATNANGVARPAAEEKVEIDPVVYSQVQALRDELALTNQDLAALSCTSEQAMAVLESLKTWVEHNAPALEAAMAAERETQGQLRQTYQQIHVGPRNEQLIRSIPTLEQGVQRAAQQRESVQNGAATQVASLLDGPQRLVWDRTRHQQDLPGVYRYVSNLTKEQAQKLDVALRRRSNQGRDQALTPGQLRETEEVRSRIATAMPAVLDAEQAVLPPAPAPEDLNRATGSVPAESLPGADAAQP